MRTAGAGFCFAKFGTLLIGITLTLIGDVFGFYVRVGSCINLTGANPVVFFGAAADKGAGRYQ